MEVVKSADGTAVACEGADDGRALVVGVGDTEPFGPGSTSVPAAGGA